MQSRMLYLIIGLCQLMSLISSTEAARYIRKKGESVQFNFKQYGSGCSYRLSFNKIPFNDDGTPLKAEGYGLSEHRRTTIEKDCLSTTCVISVGIINLKASDAGHYSCMFKCRKKTSYQYHNLQVYHPPGVAHCSWSNEDPIILSSNETVSPLDCSAKKGQPRGYLVCLHKSIQGTTLYRPFPVHLASNNITARIWINRKLSIRCCSQTSHFPKSFRNCSDFISQVVRTTVGHSRDFITELPSDNALFLEINLSVGHRIQSQPLFCSSIACIVVYLLTLLLVDIG